MHSMKRTHDLEQYANDRISEQLSGETGTATDLVATVEQLEHDFDFDSYAPYTSQEDDILSDYESDYWQDAKDLLGDTQYTADDWATAKRAYVAAIAYSAFSSIFEQSKTELTEAIEEFSSDAADLSGLDPEIAISSTCPHGWAAHNREEDGALIWESRQLDGCNAISKQVGELWLTHTWTPKPEETEIRPYGPGKFSTMLDSYVYSVSLDGGCDEESGDVSESGEWFGIMRNGRTIFRDHDPMLETLNTAEQDKLTSAAGVILREDSQGFVSVDYYQTADSLELAWSQIVDHLSDDPQNN
jgi:hypothetical protein